METINNKNILLNRREAAQYLGGICLTTLNRLGIHKFRIRRRVFYCVEDIKRWIEEHTIPPEVRK